MILYHVSTFSFLIWNDIDSKFTESWSSLEQPLSSSVLFKSFFGSVFLWLLKSCRKNFYVISKYIFIQSKYISFNQNEFVFKKIYIYIYFKKYILFHLFKMFVHYMNFSFDTFLVTISGLPFLFSKVTVLFSVYKLNNSAIL